LEAAHDDKAAQSWVLGFVSGANLMNLTEPEMRKINDSFLQHFSEDDVFTRIDFYCRDHQSDRLFRAAAFVTADFMRTHASRLEECARLYDLMADRSLSPMQLEATRTSFKHNCPPPPTASPD
jgi:hypothetical protein